MRSMTLTAFTLSTLIALPALATPTVDTKVRLHTGVGQRTTQRGTFSMGSHGGLRGRIVERDANARLSRQVVITLQKPPGWAVSPTAPGLMPLKISGENGRPLDIAYARQHAGKHNELVRFNVLVPSIHGELSRGDINAIMANLLGRGSSFQAKWKRTSIVPATGQGEFVDGQGRGIQASWRFNRKMVEVAVRAEDRGEYQAAKLQAAQQHETGATGNLIAVSSRAGGPQDLILRRFIDVNAKGEIVHRVVSDGQQLTPNAVREAIERLATN